MRRFVLPLLAAVCLLTCQTTLLGALVRYSVNMDLLLILTLYLSLTYPAVLGGILAFGVGLLMDAFSGNAFGIYALSRPLVFFAAKIYRERFYLEGYSARFLFVLVFSALEGLLVLLTLQVLNPFPLSRLLPLFLNSLLLHSLPTGLLAVAVFRLLDRASFLPGPSEPAMGEKE
jgi:rod shape-determining protein MreD